MRKDETVFLRHMLDAVASIREYVEGVSFDGFMKDRQLQDAVVRRLEIIGEAARNVPEAIRLRHPAVAWREAVGFRNVLIHQYFGIDVEVLWLTARSDLIGLRADLERVVEAEKNDRLSLPAGAAGVPAPTLVEDDRKDAP